MSDANLIYHYTSFEKLQCILRYGTLRFKESTKSNDVLDTMGFVNILKGMPRFKAPVDITKLLNFIIGYYQSDAYSASSISLVSCFSRIPDSRLLWDAYTMHRPANQRCTYGEDKYCCEVASKYNGVCIAFRQDQLAELLAAEEGVSCDKAYIRAIDYEDARPSYLLNEWLKEAAQKSCKLAKDPDQSQNMIPPLQIGETMDLELKKSLVIPMLDFMKKVEAYSPFYKHAFWHEEDEIRASLLITKGHISRYENLLRCDDGAKYCDVLISPECIDHIILGPEFDEESFAEIERHADFKLDLSSFELKKSAGTGVIRSSSLLCGNDQSRVL